MKRKQQDGRTQRAADGRQRVSESLVALVVKHGRMPTVEEVAARAGVGRRSVFRYFDGIEALEVETARMMRSQMTQRVPLPAPEGGFEQRLNTLVQHRARLYEGVTPVRRFLESARQRGNHAFDGFIDEARRILREHLRAMLGEELARRPDLLPVLDVLTSWEAWVALREGQKRSVQSAQKVLGAALQALIEPVTRPGRSPPVSAKAKRPRRTARTR